MAVDSLAVPGKFLEPCNAPPGERTIEPFTLVIFGGGGDLSRRKLLPALFHLYRDGELSSGFSILGFGRREMNDEQYREMVKEAVQAFGDGAFDESLWSGFAERVFFHSGHFEDDEAYRGLVEKIGTVSLPPDRGKRNLIYYMSVPPHVTPVAVGMLSRHELCRGKYDTRVIVEKPFGFDLASAKQLNAVLTGAFGEDRVYRIDHYLGKETVQNIIFFRFSNAVFEQIWNSNYIDNVQITVAEEIGIEERGTFYEQTGVVRDIVQNHIMQLLALVAMEPPIGFEADFIRDEKGKVFRAISAMDNEYIDRCAVRGQYGAGTVKGAGVSGYRAEKGVAAASAVPTFFAGKFSIANWRWAGVPFYVRTGKRLARHVTEICIQFKQPPLRLFGRTCDALEPNILVLTIQPEEKISLRFGVKYPHVLNRIYPVNMVFGYQDAFKVPAHPAYERLLIDCMKGDLTLFVRQDGVEAIWEALDPLLARWENTPPPEFPNYAAGSWGPDEAGLLLRRDGRSWLTV